jgi:exodeoxyribonuclease V alpha subunit
MNMPSHAKGQARSVLAPVQALTTLDRAWADFLCQQIPATCETQIWLAALTSHQWGRGHACLDVTALQTDAAALLGWTQADAQALPSNWAQALASLPWCEGDTAPLVASANRLYLRRAWRAETRIRQHLQARQDGAPVQVDPSTNGLDALFGPVDPQAPQHSQRLACAMALRQRTCIITGGPGTGKTTTVMRLLALLQAAHGPAPLRVLLAAPTGKAAARLNASMAQAHAALPADWQTALPAEAQTLHKMLGWHGLATPLTGQRQLHADVVVVDEASMIDLEMMARLLQAVPTPARLVLLGDKDQLASVEAGAVMAQLCESPWLRNATATLTHSHRFGHDSAIGQWAQAVNTGDRARLQALWQQASTDSDPQAVGVSRWQAGANQHAMWGTAQVARVRAGWSEWLQRMHPAPSPGPWPEPTAFSDAQARLCLNDFSRLGVLCALREGPWGVHAFNLGLARSLGLPGSGWYSGRPVVVTRNDSALGLMNGDVGLCLPRAVNGQTALQVAFADGADGVRWVAPTRLEHVDTALAMTVHQSQGSEFDAVLLVLPERDAPVLSRELIYTGITRARHSLGIWAPEPQVWWNACARVTQRSGGLRE